MEQPPRPTPDDEGPSPTQPLPTAGSGAQPGGGGRQYPRQQLTEQQVQQGRSRTPWIIGTAVLVVVALVATTLWLVLADGDEGDREAYCAALADVTNDGDLAGALEGADESTATALSDVAELAPDVVADDWQTLVELAQDPGAISGGDSMSTALDALSAVRTIARDAEDECGLDLDLPFG